MSLGLVVVFWISTKNQLQQIQNTQAEYVIVVEATKEIVWIRNILEYL